MKEKIYNYMLDIGYTSEEIDYIINSYPICELTEEKLYDNIKRNYEYFIKLEYSKEEIIKMTKSLPQLFGYSIENIKQKIQDIIDIGYSKEETIKMTKSSPALFGYSIENIKQKIQDIMDIGYSKEETIKMTKTLPALFGYSIENIKEKIDYLRNIDLEFIVLSKTMLLMQSVNLTYSRYEYFKEKGILIDKNNYIKLFMNSKQFEKCYGITKKELIENYDYNKYKEKKKNGISI